MISRIEKCKVYKLKKTINESLDDVQILFFVYQIYRLCTKFNKCIIS